MRLFGTPDVGRLQRKGNINALVKALGHSDHNIRREAASALGQLKDARAQDPLIATLSDPSPEVRAAAATALGEFQRHRGLEKLAELCWKDPNASARSAATETLRTMGDPYGAMRVLLGAGGKQQKRVTTAITELGPLGVEALIAALNDTSGPFTALGRDFPKLISPRSDFSAWAAKRLIDIGSPAFEPVLAYALKNWPDERTVAILKEIDGDRVMASFLSATNDTSAAVRERAVRALGLLEDARAVNVLAASAADQAEGADVRIAAQDALARLGGHDALQALVGSLKDPNPHVRLQATVTLGGIRTPQAAEALGDCLEDTDERVRARAAEALAEISDPSAAQALADALLGPNEVLEAAQALGRLRAIEPLIDAMSSPNDKIRRAAAASLAPLGDRRAYDVMSSALADPHMWVRCEAATALGTMRDARAVDALIRALEDSEMWVRAQAATSLGKIGDARATEALRRALEDVGTSAEPDIDERMADKLTYPVREAAKKALDRMAYSNRNLLASRREHRLP